jgi:predicted AlkP superfamily pyrophosphatase or phosphodiesterase
LPRLITSLFGDQSDRETAERLLGPLAGSYQHVVVCFIDAFGRRFYEQYAERHPFLRRIAEEGVVTPITSQFPSTTAAHVTTIHTGLSVGQSGVYEWLYYEPRVDAIIAPLLFSFAGDRPRGTLSDAGVQPADLFPTGTFYQTLTGLGVQAHVVLPGDLAGTPYGDVIMQGARVLPYATFTDALTTIADLVTAGGERTYSIVYLPSIDSAGHRYGPESTQFAAAVDLCFTALEKILHARLSGSAERTLLLLIADHGQMAVDPATTIYLNQRFPVLSNLIKTNRNGKLLAPAGSCRDLFLHIHEEHVDEAQTYLQEELTGHSAVYRVSDLIDEGFFGPEPLSPTFLARVGNLVVLPYAGQSVFWYEAGRFEQRFHGAHGGLSPEEMETMLLGYVVG